MRNPMNLSYLFSILFFYVLIKFQKTETGNKQVNESNERKF